MDALPLFNVPMSTLRSLSSDRQLIQVGFSPLNGVPSSLSWKIHVQSSDDFKEMVLRKRRSQCRSFAFNIRNILAKDGSPEEGTEQPIHGEVILQKVSLFNITDYAATLTDDASELTGNKVYFQLVSGDQVDPENGMGKTASEASYLHWKPFDGPIVGDTHYEILFKWNSSLGFPGAVLIKNMHSRELFLKSLILDIPGGGKLRFKCNSWIFPFHTSKCYRIFFSNKSYLPELTPAGLKKLREQDMVELRGDGLGERKLSDRIYDYDVYNDIGNPDSNPELRREVLGGSKEFPYPRRCRTGRPPAKTNPKFESRVVFPNVNFIPPDERFPHTDFSDFASHAIVAFGNTIAPTIADLFETAFETLAQVEHLYVRGFKSPYNSHKRLHQHKSSLQIVERILEAAEDNPLINFVRPQVLAANDSAWKTDREFARQVLAGLNPMMIQCLDTFPPFSKLDPNIYGPQQSSICGRHIEKFLDGLSVAQAVASKRLFILDYYDAYMLYAERINKLSENIKTYATRTLFFLTDDGQLKPVAIELCLPPTADQKAVRNVYTPTEEGTEEGMLWELARAHVRVNDSGYHQLVNHWLRTHAVMEPFIIATHRQLSRMHPLYKLLIPHYLNTMDINQAARQSLISAAGVIEQGFTPGKYSMEMSSTIYKEWRFNEQGLPADLIKRGMAFPDPTAPHGLRLVIEDYPYAVDGLEKWIALKEWVSDFLSLYYKDDSSIKRDRELQSWWDDIVNVGHGDLKDDPSRWYKMETKDEAVEAVTTIIWLASAHHAAVNFGQYSYGGYMPNHPTISRRHVPEKGSEEYSEMLSDIQTYYLKTVSTPSQATLVMAVLEILSKHAKNEVYLGQIHGSTPDWANDNRVDEMFNRFSSRLVQVEKNVTDRNNNCDLKNRHGQAQVPYTLLYPNTTDLSKTGGLTGRGVPNSISI